MISDNMFYGKSRKTSEPRFLKTLAIVDDLDTLGERIENIRKIHFKSSNKIKLHSIKK